MTWFEVDWRKIDKDKGREEGERDQEEENRIKRRRRWKHGKKEGEKGDKGEKNEASNKPKRGGEMEEEGVDLIVWA